MYRLRFVVASAVLIAALSCEGPAAAKPPDWHMQIALLTDFPIHLGGQVTVEMPEGFQFSTALGELPAPYVDVINAVALGFDAYGQETADLVRASLRDSLVWRLHVGWRPIRALGLYVEFGYGLVTLGSLVRGDNIVTVLDDEVRDQFTPEIEETMKLGRYDVNSTLHMLDVEVGWRWIIDSGWMFRVAVGLAATLHGHTSVVAVSSALPAEIDALVASGTALHLDRIYRDHVHVPVISFAVGHRFF